MTHETSSEESRPITSILEYVALLPSEGTPALKRPASNNGPWLAMVDIGCEMWTVLELVDKVNGRHYDQGDDDKVIAPSEAHDETH